MKRFLLLSLPLLVVLSALFNLGLELAGLQPDLGPMVGWRSGALGLPGAWVLATWALEALALTALFLLIDGRGGWRWLNGLLTGWIAWVFRGPLLVMTAVGFAHLSRQVWWQTAFRWFVLYTLAGLLLAVIARLSGLDRSPAPAARPPAIRGEPRPAGKPEPPRPVAVTETPPQPAFPSPPVPAPQPVTTPPDAAGEPFSPV